MEDEVKSDIVVLRNKLKFGGAEKKGEEMGRREDWGPWKREPTKNSW